jgi:WD40 repeat protein
MPAADARGEAARVFISYSLQDGVQAAADLREWLLRENLSVWQDRITLQGGRDWWSQIEDALKSKPLQHMVLVVTPGALASAVVRREIRLARQEGKTVSPVRGPGLGDFRDLPRWLGQVYDIDQVEHRTTLLRVLQAPSNQKRVPMMAPEPPSDFVARPAEFETLKQQLLDTKGDAVAITAALRGAGGYGKTTLARALAHDPGIQDAYFDGVLWAELGERPDNLLSIISDLIEILAGERPGLENVTSAAAKLGEALGDRRILLIVDDVWREQDLRPFLQGGDNATRLITTRLNRVLPTDTFRQPVDAMARHEARELLSAGLPAAQATRLMPELANLAQRLGEWAQLLKLVNGFLRERVNDAGEALEQAIAGANERLTEEGLAAFDANDEDDRTKAIARTINLSLGLLDDTQRARFNELAIFPEDADIPIGIVARLWQQNGTLTEGRTKDLLVKFSGLSLLLALDLNERTFRFHDTVRRFLQDKAGESGLMAQHKGLLVALGEIEKASVDMLTRRYYYLYLPRHLAGAGDGDALKQLLLDPFWLINKLGALRDPQALIADYERPDLSETHDLIGRTLRLTSGICARDRKQLLPQLLDRLMSFEAPSLSTFLWNARESVELPAILTMQPSLTPPGAENARLEGHRGAVQSLCVLLDGRLASGSDDNTIRLWDVKTGAETARLEGHSGSVKTMCVLPDGRLASGSSDNTIRLWDVNTGTESARLESHAGTVTALCMLPDGRLAWGTSDNTIRLWDVNADAESVCGDENSIKSLCVLPDGRLVSGAYDNTIRLWDVKVSGESARLEGHLSVVSGLCALPDGRLVSVSWDSTIRLWDVNAGVEIVRQNAGLVFGLCVLADGRIATGCHDNTIRLWDVLTSDEYGNPGIKISNRIGRLEGHSASVNALCVLRDGRLASCSDDGTIRLWNVIGDEHGTRVKKAASAIKHICPMENGDVAVSSNSEPVRIYNARTRNERLRLAQSTRGYNAICGVAQHQLAVASPLLGQISLWDTISGAMVVQFNSLLDSVSVLIKLKGNYIASGSKYGEIRIWNSSMRGWRGVLTGHSGPVTGLAMLPDDRIASASLDGTIRFWNLDTLTESVRFGGGTGPVRALCALLDGRIASASGDRIRLWDWKAGINSNRLKGHSREVTALCPLSAGRLVSGADDNTIRVWDLNRGFELCRLEIDAPVRSLAKLTENSMLAGDAIGRLHWLEIID